MKLPRIGIGNGQKSFPITTIKKQRFRGIHVQHNQLKFCPEQLQTQKWFKVQAELSPVCTICLHATYRDFPIFRGHRGEEDPCPKKSRGAERKGKVRSLCVCAVNKMVGCNSIPMYRFVTRKQSQLGVSWIDT